MSTFDISTVGKRLSTKDPLTVHDVAERLDKAMLRTVSILLEARSLGLMEGVLASRYHTNVATMLAEELAMWGIEPEPVPPSPTHR